MGTSGAYGGSGGSAWSRARRRARNLPPNPTDADLDHLMQAIGDALPYETPEAPVEPQAPREPVEVSHTPPISWGPISARPRSGGGDGPGAAGGRRGGGERPATGGGTRRSARRAASVGGRAARVAAAFVTGDTRTLEELGLNLAELEGLSPVEQAQRISARVVVGDSIENAELRVATDALVLAQLREGRPLTAIEAAQVFATALIDEVMETEMTAALQSGRRTIDEIRDIERRVRDTVRASVEGLVREGDTTMDAEAVIADVLGRAQRVLRRSGARR